MIESTNTIRIERPAWFVFEFIVDIENSPIFEQFGMKAIQVSPGPVGLGTEYQLVHSNYQRLLRVVDFEKDQKISVTTVEQSAPKLDLRIQLVPEEDQLTLMNLEWKLSTGLPGLVERMLAGKITQGVSDSLYDLRELLETGSVTLGNGDEVQIPKE